MRLTEMLALYRQAAGDQMQAIASEFAALSPSDQRELLFWMIIDTTTNPTRLRDVRPNHPAGTA